ncbi:TAP42-like protein [Melampsora americana]|nr:TAP42-like protein [Melampsora americana]
MSNHESTIEDDISLGQLLDRATKAYEEVQVAPSPNDNDIQSKILCSISNLKLCDKLIKRLGILSTNETIEDITTKDLKCLTVNGLIGMLTTLRKTNGGNERKSFLEIAKNHLSEFIGQLESYEVIQLTDRSRYQGPSSTVKNQALRREGKISQYKLEKELQFKLNEYKKRKEERNQPRLHSKSDKSTLDLRNENLEEEEEEDGEREVYLTWLKFLYLKSYQEISSIEQELELLGTSSQMENLSHRTKRSGEEEEEDLSWRLDKLSTKSGPLIGPSGKVLRPFTILPSSNSFSSATDRIRLKSEVFRPDWNLPTMTIDEYLDEQESMGNFLKGGGPGQAEKETDGERVKREAEDDNMNGEEMSERLRKEAIEWNEFTDTHRKGEGNMMNRG